MTSARFNAERSRAAEEMEAYGSLPSALRAALDRSSVSPPRATVVLNAMLRGVPIEAILAVIQRAQKESQK